MLIPEEILVSPQIDVLHVPFLMHRFLLHSDKRAELTNSLQHRAPGWVLGLRLIELERPYPDAECR